MISIRRKVFETNSSSTHSLTVCSEDEYSKWVKGELYLKLYDNDNHLFYTREELIKEIKDRMELCSWITDEDYTELVNAVGRNFSDLAFDLTDGDFIDYNIFIHDEYLTSYSEHYTTESGDKIVIFGKYGYNG